MDEEVVEQPCLDPRIGEMVRSLNLGKEGEKLFLEANISYEVLQHLTKDDLQVRLSRAFDLCSSHGRLACGSFPLIRNFFYVPGARHTPLHTIGRLQLHTTSTGELKEYGIMTYSLLHARALVYDCLYFCSHISRAIINRRSGKSYN